MRGKFHTHEGLPKDGPIHDHNGEDIPHEHWFDGQGVAFVHYTRINRTYRQDRVTQKEDA